MIKVSDIFDFIDSFAPFKTAMDFDNVGILVGDKSSEVKRCLVALDVTKDVIFEAKTLGANLIISHHPVIFNAIKKLENEDIPYILAKNEISAICAHTNLDVANFGVNSCLAEALSLQKILPLSSYVSKLGEVSFGLFGELEKSYYCDEFAKFVKAKLNCNGVRYTEVDISIKKVAVCSGAGGDLISAAIKQRVDAFVTGEIKHHEILEGLKNKICIVDAGHFKTEDVVILPLIQKLSKEFKDIEFKKSKSFTDGIKYMA